MPTPTQVTVVEFGAIPPSCWRAREAVPEVSVLLAQQADEAQRHFLHRVRGRLAQLRASAHTLTHGRLVLSRDAGATQRCERLQLGRDLVLALDSSGHAALELTGQLTRTYEGAVAFWDLVEALTTQGSPAGVIVKASPETPLAKEAAAVRAQASSEPKYLLARPLLEYRPARLPSAGLPAVAV